MEILNGYTIVGEWYVSPRERVIAGYRNVDNAKGHHTVWVTARAIPRDENPREWYWGHYFDSSESHVNKRDAMADFAERSDIKLAVTK